MSESNGQMTPQQALSILDQIASRAHLTRGDHIAAVQAVNVLSELVEHKAGLPAHDVQTAPEKIAPS